MKKLLCATLAALIVALVPTAQAGVGAGIDVRGGKSLRSKPAAALRQHAKRVAQKKLKHRLRKAAKKHAVRNKRHLN